jgi:hypothetical protein
LRNYFAPETKEHTGTFIASVESLNGNEGDDGRRYGEVILALFIDNESVSARVNLDLDNYEIAYKAHGSEGGLIKVKGKLRSGKRVRNLDEVEFFEPLNYNV